MLTNLSGPEPLFNNRITFPSAKHSYLEAEQYTTNRNINQSALH